MQFSLPAQHGLLEHVLEDARLMPRTHDGAPSITDVQFDGLSRCVVYLVTYRALARQTFDELRSLLCARCFDGDMRCVVLTNGDAVEPGRGGPAGSLTVAWRRRRGLCRQPGLQSLRAADRIGATGSSAKRPFRKRPRSRPPFVITMSVVGREPQSRTPLSPSARTWFAIGRNTGDVELEEKAWEAVGTLSWVLRRDMGCPR